MASRPQPVRGTHDLLPEAHAKHRHVIETAREIAERYGFRFAATPIVEPVEVFKRTLGDTSDVVTKEMYAFEDRGGDTIVLRPEGTAGICRAFVTAGLAQQTPVKWFYAGPMFRYERPQKGRQRQFHQIGVELLGAPPGQADVEVIACGQRILDALIPDAAVVLHLNTLGDPASRTAYRDALVAYFTAHKDGLSADSLARLDRNPLRILDSKDAGDQALVAAAPAFDDFLNDTSVGIFDDVKRGLDAVGVPYHLNPRLVRGLDYYGHTAFEFVAEGLGAQATVLAGGRYDGLVEMMGGPATPGVGWAAGVERLALLSDTAVPAPRPIAVVPLEGDRQIDALALAERLRGAGWTVDQAYAGNVGKRMKRADKAGARAAILVGGDEWTRQTLSVRDLDGGDQAEVPTGEIEAWLTEHLG